MENHEDDSCVLSIDCKELTTDEQLALAAAISDRLQGIVLALVQGDRIVMDRLTDGKVDDRAVLEAVQDYVSGRKDSEHYSVERNGDVLTVHSPDPIAARHRRVPGLPGNVKQCPFCPFVTPYDELYTVHVRSHGFT